MTETENMISTITDAFNLLSNLINTSNIILIYGLILFLISAIVGLYLNRHDKNVSLSNLMDVLKYCFGLAMLMNQNFALKNFELILVCYLIINVLFIFSYNKIFFKNNVDKEDIKSDEDNLEK